MTSANLLPSILLEEKKKGGIKVGKRGRLQGELAKGGRGGKEKGQKENIRPASADQSQFSFAELGQL